MTCLGSYEMFYFFLTLCFIVTKFCVLVWLFECIQTIIIYSYSSFMKCPPPPPPSEILCYVFKFYWLSDEAIKHWFNLYFN